MSGTNGPPRRKPTPPIACDKLIFKTFLNSPMGIEKLKIGDKLEVGIETKNGAQIAVVFLKKTVFGSITHSNLVKLLKCLNEGYEYLAEVTQIDGGSCQVQVYPIKSAR